MNPDVEQLFFAHSKNRIWLDGYFVTPASTVDDLDAKTRAQFRAYFSKYGDDRPLDIDLEYSPFGFFINREFMIQGSDIFLLCCRKKISASDIDLKTLSNFLHQDFSLVSFVVFLSALPLKNLFSIFYNYGRSSPPEDVKDYENISFREFIDIFSDTQIPIEDLLVKRIVV